jgi:hypothetical protein
VTIDYTKVGVCGSYEPNPGASPEEVQFANPTFLVYTITSILSPESRSRKFLRRRRKRSTLVASHEPGLACTRRAQRLQRHPERSSQRLFYHTPAGQSVPLDETDNGTAIINGGICTPASAP